MRKQLILIRGLQGSGKSTFATMLKRQAEIAREFFLVSHYEADTYFLRGNGEYVFNATELPQAHAWCKEATYKALKSPYRVMVIVSNTFSQMWEMQPYIDMAKELNAELTILTVETTLTDDELAARNVNKCPVEAIARVRNRWECLTTR